jgi:hypothetical protein
MIHTGAPLLGLNRTIGAWTHRPYQSGRSCSYGQGNGIVSHCAKIEQVDQKMSKSRGLKASGSSLDVGPSGALRVCSMAAPSPATSAGRS